MTQAHISGLRYTRCAALYIVTTGSIWILIIHTLTGRKYMMKTASSKNKYKNKSVSGAFHIFRVQLDYTALNTLTHLVNARAETQRWNKTGTGDIKSRSLKSSMHKS